MFGAGDVRIESIPDARLIEPTDALVQVTRACICGSDLWPYKAMEHSETGRVMGHTAGSSVMKRSPGRRPKQCAYRLPMERYTFLRVGKDDALIPSLLTLSDVMGTGHHAAISAKVGAGKCLQDVLEERIDPGRVFDRVVGLDGVPDGYRAMNERKAIKIMVTP